VVKLDQKKKARRACDGANVQDEHGQRVPVSLGDAHAASVSQVELRIFVVLAAFFCWTALGGDATNAFAHSPGPKGNVFMAVNEQRAR
jgi:hypothetical protein